MGNFNSKKTYKNDMKDFENDRKKTYKNTKCENNR